MWSWILKLCFLVVIASKIYYFLRIFYNPDIEPSGMCVVYTSIPIFNVVAVILMYYDIAYKVRVNRLIFQV